MSTRTPEDRARSRAEARRRARQMARGEPVADAPVPAADPTPGSRGNVFSRLFPPAPPLPNRPDPLAGFDRAAPLRPIRERLFLLRHNLLAWIVPALVTFLSFYASVFYARSILGLISTFVLFGAIIGAGWYGWQRPTLFGTVAAVLGFLGSAAVILGWFATVGAPPETFRGTLVEVLIGLGVQTVVYAAIGFLGGWYGGYLRRRQTQLSAEVRRRR
jgi:hypothetical protein